MPVSLQAIVAPGHQREPLDLTPGGAMKTFLKLRGWQKAGSIRDD